MPRMKEVKRLRRATDHRALVLEVVATTPVVATREAVQSEVAGLSNDFHRDAISAMVSTLLRDGLLGRRDDGTLFVTAIGMDWLTHGEFDRALPKPHTKTRKKK